jgi:hypothetical protein
VTRRLQKLKRLLVGEAGGRCAVCGYERCVVNLHFHHVDPAAKSFALSVASGKSVAAYRREAQKCVLVRGARLRVPLLLALGEQRQVVLAPLLGRE